MIDYIFADESNLNSRFMLIGGIWVDVKTYKAVVEECNNFKSSIGWSKDAKLNWKNVSKLTLPHYKDFIDIFFKYNLKFNAIIIDQKEICLKKNCDNDPELGFYKFYYLLIWNNSSNSDLNSYQIFLDRRNNKKETRLSELQEILKYGKPKYLLRGLNIKSLKPVDSKDYNLIQFSDILLGAIGYQYNKRNLKQNSSQVKCELANHIAKRLGKDDLCFSTNKYGYKNINIWLFKPNIIKSAL